MLCVVTGVGGFIGSHVAESLLNRGHDVCGIDMFTDFYSPALKRRNTSALRNYDRFELIEADVRSASITTRVLSAEVVYHLAGQPGVRRSWQTDFVSYVDRNILSTHALLETVRRSTNIRRFVFASSSSVYGSQPRYPCREDAIPLPESPYGATKLAAEHLCKMYAASFSVPTVCMRYFTVYGPRQRPDMAVSQLIERCISGEPIRLNGDGQQVRDMTFVYDVVEATISAGELDLPAGAVINVSSNHGVSLIRLARTILDLTGANVPIVYGPPAHGDVVRTEGANGLAERLLHWRPFVDTVPGLEAQLEWRLTSRIRS